jgi:lipopolysaccharide export system permease protein
MTQCVVCNTDKNSGKLNVVSVQSYEFTEPLPPEVFGGPDMPRSSDVSWPELFRRAKIMRHNEEASAARIDAMEAEIAANPDPDRVNILRHYRDVQRYGMRMYRSFEAEKHLRPALAVGCICFVLLGASIGVRANRADFLSSFIIGFLPVVLIYYPILICGTNFAKEGRVPIPIAVWVADALFAVVAVGMCWRLVRR